MPTYFINLIQQSVKYCNYFICCLFFFIFFTFNAIAGVSVFNNYIDGSKIKTSQSLDVFDQFYPEMLANQANFTNKSAKGRVILKYDEGDTISFSDDWEVVVTYNLYTWDANGVMTTQTSQELKIDYKKPQPIIVQQPYNNISFLEFFNSYMARVRITNVAVNGLNAPFTINNIPNDIKLELEIETERFLDFDFSVSTDIWHNSSYMLGDKYADLKWVYMHGAEEYDLEWFFFSDKYNGSFTSPSDVAPEDFTRVTVSNTHYRLELPFVKGTLIYRVRGVGKHGPGFAHRMEGAWTNQTSDRVAVGNIDVDRNWKYDCAYAEEGKRKESISYLDGTFRSRQSIARNNTNQVSLISESFYDYEGRPAIQTIPAPGFDDSQNQAHSIPPPPGGSRSNRLEFYKNYSLNPNAVLFSKKDFDKQAIGNACEIQPALEMHPGNGAANYFSEFNPDLTGNFASFHSYIPDAENLPYSQTTYDKEGRVAKTTAPGSTLALGATRETSYDYATPIQTKLDRLFGNEVGYASHYSVKMVTDPNGQASIAYSNLSDKVIATSLIGENPDNLFQLNSNSTGAITSHFNHQNLYVPSEEGYIMRSKFLVESPGEHQFTYTLEPEVYHSLCSGEDYDCVYDLTMTIFDKCELEIYDGNQDPYQGPSDKILHKGTQVVNNQYIQSTPLTFSVFFNKAGVYYVEKKLILNKQTLQEHIDNLVASLPGSCIDDYETKLNDSLNLEGCLTCEEFCDAYPTLCAEDECDVQVNAKCDVLLKVLKEDISPGGQYFEKNLGTQKWVEKYIVNNFLPATNWNYMGFFDPNQTLIDNWAALKLYWNHDGTDWATKPFNSAVTTNYGKTINSLVEAHPEYCQYTTCTTLIESTKFNYKLASLTLAQAQSKGYLPTTNPSQKCTTSTNIFIGEEIVDDDDFFSTPGNVFKNAMKSKMQFSDGISILWIDACNISLSVSCLWKHAISLVEKSKNCPGTPAGTDEEYWEEFKKLYITLKEDYVNLWKLGEDCFYLCDATTPVPDDIADHSNTKPCLGFPPNPNCPSGLSNCYDYIDGFEIRVPNYDTYFNTIKNSNTPGNIVDDIIDDLENKVKCGVSSKGKFNILPFNAHPNECVDLSEISEANQSISIIYNTANDYCTSPPCTLQIASFNLDNTLTLPTERKITLFEQIENGINNYQSTPKFYCDYLIYKPYTCNPQENGEAAEFSIWCDEIGPNGNGNLLFSSGFNNLISGTPYYVNVTANIIQEPAGGAFTTCPEDSLHCLCTKLTLLADYAASENLNVSDYLDNFITTNYPNIAYTAGDAYMWLLFCLDNDLSSPLDPLHPEYSIPDEILNDNEYCNPTQEPCEQESFEITSFYGNQFYEAAVQAEIEKFKKEYKEHCFALLAPNNFKEHFQVEYQDYEYHFTLYYYDQAGNLVRTVPPAGVNKLTQIAANAVDAFRTTNMGSPVFPTHTFITKYEYNTLNQLVKQKIPDDDNIGLTNFSHTFFYDNAGRLKASQNSKQANTTPVKYSYTAFDGQGRIIEVGELLSSTAPTQAILNNSSFPSNWVAASSRKEVTYTLYDTPYNPFISNKFLGGQNNLRNRVAATYFKNSGADANYRYASHYNYDIHGNVNELIHESSEMPPFANASPGFGKSYSVRYKYDLISGNVNDVMYQAKYADRYFHKYWYDADNRLRDAYTSREGLIWDLDGQYEYYMHGPMARLEYGQRKVQGSDYAYTITGWLKALNGNRLIDSDNMGKDGIRVDNQNNTPYYSNNRHLHHKVAADAFAFSLHYFENDYQTISQNSFANNFYNNINNVSITAGQQANLYNGNISHIGLALIDLMETPMNIIASCYRYDQLNRIREGNIYISTTNNYTNASNNGSYNTNMNYDANGNLLNLERNGHTGVQLPMDDLAYNYIAGTNKLSYVTDNVSNSPYSTDIESGQAAGNYTYDAIGNLMSDTQEEIQNIEWTTYGKVAKITRTNNSAKYDMEFRYSPNGHRIMKIEKPRPGGNPSTQDKWVYTHYTHDAQGNVMAIYKQIFLDKGSNTWESQYELSELPIYGSSRLGLTKKEALWNNTFKASINGTTGLFEPVSGSVTLPSPGNVYKTWQSNDVITVSPSENTNFEVFSLGYSVLKSADAFAPLTILSGDAIQQGDSIIIPANTYAKINAETDFTIYSNDWVEVKLEKNSNFAAPTQLTLIDLALNLNNNTSLYNGEKAYELSSHLGNVHVVISDRKLAVDDGTYSGGVKINSTPDGIIDFFEPDVLVSRDFFPFGMEMPGRSFNSTDYAYGFNTQEKVDEISGSGNHYTAPFWEYDPRTGRRWNLDPAGYPFQSHYSVNNNNSILFSDPLGIYGTKREARQMRREAKAAGLDPSKIYKSGDDYGFNTVEDGAIVGNFKRNYFGSEGSDVQSATNLGNDPLFENPFKRISGTFAAERQITTFLLGTSDNKNYFEPSSGFSYMMKNSPGVREGVDHFLKTGETEKSYGFSPNVRQGTSEFLESLPKSIDAHLDVLTNANLPRLAVGGYKTVITPVTGNDNIVRIHLVNDMSMGSLLLHWKWARENPPKTGPLSTVEMKIDLGLFDISPLKK